jgi:hypothetical protein
MREGDGLQAPGFNEMPRFKCRDIFGIKKIERTATWVTQSKRRCAADVNSHQGVEVGEWVVCT